MLKKTWMTICLTALVGIASPALAATWYVAPLGAVFPGVPNGTIVNPFVSTDTALASGMIQGGDTVLLMDGAHPMLRVQTAFSTPVTFESQTDRRARVDSIYLSGAARNIIVRDLKVWPTNPLVRQSVLVVSSSTTSDNQFVNLDVRAGEDAYNYPAWSASEWANRKTSGAFLDGARLQMRQSNFTGVYFGVVVSGDSGLVAGNTIDGFSGDGLRGNGPRGTFRDNIAQNCANFDGNHADGFQAFSQGTITGLTIERNIFIEWMHEPNHPLRCEMQGIGLFEMEYSDLRIANNVIAIGNGHGISVYGGHGVEIVNNTVVNIDGLQPGWPWIGIYDSKTGVVSTDVLVANNLAMGYMGSNNKPNRVTFTSNRTVRSVSFAFPNWQSFVYTIRPDGRFIDAADPTFAPDLDILRRARPVGQGPDLGAYEMSTLAAAPALSDVVLEPPPIITAETDAAEAAAIAGTTAKTSSGGAKFIKAP